MKTLTESWGDRVDIDEFMFDTPDFLPSGGFGNTTQIYDRSDGRYMPIYQNEIDLKFIRAMSWLLVEKVPMAQAWCNRLVDYTIGTGFDWSIKCDSPQLQARINAIVDNVLETSSWTCDLERESFVREIVDGEWLAELENDGRQIRILSREGDELTEPRRTRELEDWLDITEFVPSWTFGVLTSKKNTERPIGYHFVRDTAGTDWDYVQESRVVHWKRNVRAKAKRGVSDYYKPHLYLKRADKVLTNTAEGAATQAAISYIVEHAQGSTKRQVENIRTQFSMPIQGDSRTSEERRQRQMRPNTRIDTPAGAKYHAGLLGSNNSQVYIEVMQSALRMAGTVHAFPEGMLTGSYANNNYASSLTAESPFVQGRVAEQLHRAGRTKQLLRKIIVLAIAIGLVPGVQAIEDIAGLAIDISPPKIFPRDVMQLTSALQLQKQNGWVSNKTAMTELGRDAAVEQSIITEEAGGVLPTDTENGDEQTNDGNASEQPRGAYKDISRMQWKRNRKAIQDIIREVQEGDISKEMAVIMLATLDISADEAERLLAGDEQPELLQEERVRAPTGYTRKKPLTVKGKDYVGGQYIPNATQKEVDQAVAKQGKPEAAKTANKKATPSKSETSKKTGKMANEKVEKSKEIGAKQVVKQKPMSEKALLAQKHHKLTDASVQRAADDAERSFAKTIKGESFRNSEPVDVVVKNATGQIAHGIEHKFMSDNSRNKIDMNRYAQVRKIVWERQNKAPLHTVVESSNGDMFYRRGVGSFRVGTMHKVTKGRKELESLMAMPEKDLPARAKRTDEKIRDGKWVQDKEGRGFINSVTKEVVRPKK